LQQIPGSHLPQVFGDALESSIFSDVLIALKSADHEDPVAEYLLGLSETRRFNTLALFMSNEDKSSKFNKV
jgi:Potential Monad-binding region of RPAP3